MTYTITWVIEIDIINYLPKDFVDYIPICLKYNI